MTKPTLLSSTFLLTLSLLFIGKLSAQQIALPQNKSVEVSLTEYTKLKSEGKLDFTNGKGYKIIQTPAEIEKTNQNNSGQQKSMVGMAKSNVNPNPNTCLPFTTSSTTATYPPGIVTDDASSDIINLPFDFCLYGTQYNFCYMTSNGVVAFIAGFTTYTATGFPATTPMITPFWSDWDANPGDGSEYGFEVFAGYAIFTWYNGGYFNDHLDMRNNCSVIITNGTDPIIPAGNNAAFIYGDMNWTVGDITGDLGFGVLADADGATAGANKGDGVNFFQIGRFDYTGINYDGPFGADDGVDWLDNKTFVFNVCGTSNNSNIAPVSISNYANCHTQVICANDTLIYDYNFVGPENNQNVTLALDTGAGIPGTQITVLNGSFGSVQFMVVNTIANGQTYHIGITATDDGTPPQSTYVDLTIALGDSSQIVQLDPHVLGNLIQCNGDTNLLTLDISDTNYLAVVWSNNSSNDSLFASLPGQYWAAVQANGCQTFYTDTVAIVNVNPTLTINGTLNICGDSTMIGVVSPNADSIWWSTGQTIIGNQTEVFSQSGNYTAYVKESGCIDSLIVPISLNPIPEIPIVTGNLHTCNGANASVSAPAGYDNYSWSNGAVTQTTSLPEGAYTLTVSNVYPNSLVCTSPPGAFNIVNSNVNVSIIGNDTVCTPKQSLSLNIADTSLHYTFQWNDGTTDSFAIESGFPDTSWVISTDQFGCIDTDKFVFWSFAPPTANFTVKPLTLSPTIKDVVFTDSSYTNSPNDNIISWHWNFGNQDDPNMPDDTSSEQSPTHQFADGDTGAITIYLVVTNSIGCNDTMEIPYTIANELEFFQAFTPNGDGKNDYFVIDYLIQKSPTNHLKVYNRWGRKIFDKENYRNDWAGDKYNTGTYYYELTHKDGTKAGFFTLIRE